MKIWFYTNSVIFSALNANSKYHCAYMQCYTHTHAFECVVHWRAYQSHAILARARLQNKCPYEFAFNATRARSRNCEFVLHSYMLVCMRISVYDFINAGIVQYFSDMIHSHHQKYDFTAGYGICNIWNWWQKIPYTAHVTPFLCGTSFECKTIILR